MLTRISEEILQDTSKIIQWNANGVELDILPRQTSEVVAGSDMIDKANSV